MISKQSFWKNKTGFKQIAFACISILISSWIGFRYAEEVFIGYLPILLWIFAVFLCFAALYPENQPALFQIKRTLTWAGIFALIIIAFLIRFINLQNLPAGFHPDEAGYVDFAILHIPNLDDPYLTINPFRTGLDSQPILYKYILRFNTFFFGMNIPAAKVSSIFIGVFAVASVFLMMNELAGRRMAWLTTILMTTYHYHVHWSRIALSNIWVTLLIPLTLGLFLLGWRKNNDKGAILAGLALGISTYIYSGGYFIIFLLIFLFIQVWRKTDNRQSLIKYTAKMLAFASVIALPLITFAILVPDHFFDRASVIRGWTDKAIQSISQDEVVTDWDYFQHQVKYSFGAYNFYPEVTGFYQPDAPFLIGFASILFLIGIPIAFRQKQYLLIFWVFIVTVLGGVMLDGTPASTHFIGVIPAICWMVAIPLDRLIERKQMNWAYTLLALILLMDLFFYFFIYASSPSLDLDVPFPIIQP